MQLPERFTKKFIVNPNGCWIWQAGKRDGYGRYHHENKWTQAHRWSYEYLRGKIPKDLELDHVVCQNRACVNPDHLEAVTHQVNVERGNSPFIINKRKTHCKRGHEFTEENTIYSNNRKYRNCRTCDNNRKHQFYIKNYKHKGYFHSKKTHCKNGHPFSGDNLFITKLGTRVCINCRKTYLKNRRNKK